MSNNISIKEKILNIKEKVLARLAYKYYRSIRCEIKVYGIDEGIYMYRHGLHRLNINKVKTVALVGLLVGRFISRF